MFSKNLPSLLSISTVLAVAIFIGILRSPGRTGKEKAPVIRDRKEVSGEQPGCGVPSIGRIQVLNGCGVDGAAEKMTDFMRTKKFNVANTGNASSWNYQFTMIVSHTKDMTVARQIAAALSTCHVVLLRTEDRAYDVTVIVGPDYEERMR